MVFFFPIVLAVSANQNWERNWVSQQVYTEVWFLRIYLFRRFEEYEIVSLLTRKSFFSPKVFLNFSFKTQDFLKQRSDNLSEPEKVPSITFQKTELPRDFSVWVKNSGNQSLLREICSGWEPTERISALFHFLLDERNRICPQTYSTCLVCCGRRSVNNTSKPQKQSQWFEKENINCTITKILLWAFGPEKWLS